MDSKWLEKLPPHKREAARKKFELRMKQRGMYSTHMYSKSLVGRLLGRVAREGVEGFARCGQVASPHCYDGGGAEGYEGSE